MRHRRHMSTYGGPRGLWGLSSGSQTLNRTSLHDPKPQTFTPKSGTPGAEVSPVMYLPSKTEASKPKRSRSGLRPRTHSTFGVGGCFKLPSYEGSVSGSHNCKDSYTPSFSKALSRLPTRVRIRVPTRELARKESYENVTARLGFQWVIYWGFGLRSTAFNFYVQTYIFQNIDKHRLKNLLLYYLRLPTPGRSFRTVWLGCAICGPSDKTRP